MMAQRTSSTFVHQSNGPAKPYFDSRCDEETVRPDIASANENQPNQTTPPDAAAMKERRMRRAMRNRKSAAKERKLMKKLIKRTEALLSKRCELHKVNAQLQIEAKGLTTQLLFAMTSQEPLLHAKNPKFLDVDSKRTTTLSPSSSLSSSRLQPGELLQDEYDQGVGPREDLTCDGERREPSMAEEE